jgi:hypothetical protein
MSAIVLAVNEKDPAKIGFAVNQLGQGRSNAVGEVTLRASQTTTTVSAPNCAAGSHVFLFPRTANAAAIVAATYVLSTNVTQGQFIITHTSNSNADKTFSYVCLG